MSEATAVRNYLAAIHSERHGQRGRPPVPVEELDRRIAAEPDKLKRLQLIQQRLDSQRRSLTDDTDELRAAFIAHAKGYAERRGISYAAWREVGVSPAVLRMAGIPRSNGHAAPQDDDTAD